MFLPASKYDMHKYYTTYWNTFFLKIQKSAYVHFPWKRQTLVNITLNEHSNWVKPFRLILVFRYNNYDKHMVGFSSIFVVVHINKINTEHGYILQFTEKLQSMITFFFIIFKHHISIKQETTAVTSHNSV